jgi:hypothetical protein
MATLYVDVRTLTSNVPPSPKYSCCPELSSSRSCTRAEVLSSNISSPAPVVYLAWLGPSTHPGRFPGIGAVLSPYTPHRDFAIQGSVTTGCTPPAPAVLPTPTTYDDGVNVLPAERASRI